tara:strand:+ start:302 stop:640 length:339 start_codon:yes stop_codon:yes gene_type:complete
MQREQAALHTFVQLHGSRLRNCYSKDRVAYLVPYSSAGVPIHAALRPYTLAEIQQEMDVSSLLVRHLKKQVESYDMGSEHVLGLIFTNPTSVLAHVVRYGAVKGPGDEGYQE